MQHVMRDDITRESHEKDKKLSNWKLYLRSFYVYVESLLCIVYKTFGF